jgi:ABC-type uncharacterized transport system YnjBCD permease subunit
MQNCGTIAQQHGVHMLLAYLVLVSNIDDSAELASLWAVVDQAHTADLYEASETLHQWIAQALTQQLRQSQRTALFTSAALRNRTHTCIPA